MAGIKAANPKPHPANGVVPGEADYLLDQLAAYGTPEKVREMVAAWDEAVDINAIGIPPGLPWEQIEAAIRVGAPTYAAGRSSL